ncbi:MAG: hypothetical protein ACP5KG_03490 [Myxococcota bacterium]
MKFYLTSLLILLSPLVVIAQSQNENPFIQNKFNPDISLIADFSFISSDIKDDSRKELEVPEFMHHPPHSHMNKDRGLHFNYLELAFTAPVDPYFDFVAISTIAPGHGIELEEVYADAKFIPYGFGLRVGQFKSAIGRHNSKHAHNWDFYDSPVIYDALLGSEGLSDVGLRLTYTFPVDFYLMLGTEIYNGSFEEAVSFGADGYTFLNKEVEPAKKPSVYTGFIKTSFDVDDHIFLLGSSIIYGHSNLIHSHHHEGEAAENPDHAISADGTLLYGFDLTYKYIIDAYRYLSLEGEFLSRIIDGTLYKLNDNGSPDNINDDFADELELHKINSGLYAQLTFKFDRRWRTGIRADYLFKPSIEINKEKKSIDLEPLYKISYMIEYNFTEFSRLRAQYNYDHLRYFEDRLLPIQEFIINFNLAVGSHGAHAF